MHDIYVSIMRYIYNVPQRHLQAGVGLVRSLAPSSATSSPSRRATAARAPQVLSTLYPRTHTHEPPAIQGAGSRAWRFGRYRALPGAGNRGWVLGVLGVLGLYGSSNQIVIAVCAPRALLD